MISSKLHVSFVVFFVVDISAPFAAQGCIQVGPRPRLDVVRLDVPHDLRR